MRGHWRMLQILALAPVLGLMAACGENDAPDDELNPLLGLQVARVVPAAEAISGAHIATLDPATMVEAEMRQVLGPGPRCVFRYTSSGRPVLAWRIPAAGEPAEAAVKLNGRLVALGSAPDAALAFAADRIHLTVLPDEGETGGAPAGGDQRQASMIFEIRDMLRVGYGGYHGCQE